MLNDVVDGEFVPSVHKIGYLRPFFLKMYAWMDKNRTDKDREKKSTSIGKLSGAKSAKQFGTAELENVGNTKAARSSAFGKHHATATALKSRSCKEVSYRQKTPLLYGKSICKPLLYKNRGGQSDLNKPSADVNASVSERGHNEDTQKRKHAQAFASNALTAQKVSTVAEHRIDDVLSFLDNNNDDFVLKPSTAKDEDEIHLSDKGAVSMEEQPLLGAEDIVEATRPQENLDVSKDTRASDDVEAAGCEDVKNQIQVEDLNETTVPKHTDLSLFVSKKSRLGKVCDSRSFVRDPTIFARFPFGYSRSIHTQQLFEKISLRQFGVNARALGVHPRRIEYCENASISTASGVTRIVFDRFGSLYAVASSNGTVRVHDFDISEHNLQVRRVPEPGTESDCLVCSVHTKRHISDIAWSPQDNEDKIVVAFSNFPELRIFDLNKIQAGSRPNMRVPSHAGNKVVLWVKGESVGSGSMLIAGGSDGVIRSFQTKSITETSFVCKWEMRAVPNKRSNKPAAALVFFARSNEGVLLSCTEGGILALWDLNNIEEGSFGAAASPQLLCEAETSKLCSSAAAKSDYQVSGVQRLDSLSSTSTDESKIVVRLAITAASGSIYFVEVHFESAKKRAERCDSRKKQALAAREKSLNQSHLTSGGFSDKNFVNCSIICCESLKGFMARPKFNEPRLNVGLEVNTNGNIRQK